MLVLKDINALSEFRQSMLLKKLREIEPTIKGVSAEYVHFVSGGRLTKAEEERLKNLLTYD